MACVMDKKSKILIIIFVIAILVSILFTYKRSLFEQNFVIFEEELPEEESE